MATATQDDKARRKKASIDYPDVVTKGERIRAGRVPHQARALARPRRLATGPAKGTIVRTLIAGNWKMNGLRADLAELDAIAMAAAAAPDVEVALALPATLISEAASRAGPVAIGGEDCHTALSGAYTGCTSAAALADAGARFVLCGHSERRAFFHESDALVKAKAKTGRGAGLITYVCVGENKEQHAAGEAVDVVAGSLLGSVPRQSVAANLVVAYEPAWAIGTGVTPSPDEIAEMHAMTRATLIRQLGEDEGRKVRILYGGSVTPANAAAILAIPEVNGALVGGASLTAAQFVPIIEAAAQISANVSQ
jgi:triosephosphate isomerase (TIM)